MNEIHHDPLETAVQEAAERLAVAVAAQVEAGEGELEAAAGGVAALIRALIAQGVSPAAGLAAPQSGLGLFLAQLPPQMPQALRREVMQTVQDVQELFQQHLRELGGA